MAESDVALLSDIHGNLQALRVVLADIKERGITAVVCLGDIVGYGGNPAECLELIRGLGCPVVKGNHDWMVSTEGKVNSSVEASIQWARRQMSPDQKAWLAALPLTLEIEDFEVAHASLWEPEAWRYLWTEDEASLHFKKQRQHVSFVGHTHRPCIWLEGVRRSIDPTGSEDMRPGKRHVVNVGSVGQPRDENPKSCYLIYSRKERVFRYRRLEYDVTGAQEAIIAAGLSPYYADRLEWGK